MKYPLVLTLIACVTLLTVSQNPSGPAIDEKCTLTPEKAPQIRGLRLGMTVEELQKLFPEEANQQRISWGINQSKQPEAYGNATFSLHPDGKATNPKFEGVNSIGINVLDERVKGISFGYSNVEWKTIDQFVAKLSDALRLPNFAWERSGESSILKCNGFRVEAYVYRSSAQSVVRVQDSSVNQIVEDRREAVKEKARQAFRP